MGENSKIEWCDHSWNPWIGCTKVSAACDHCYAETLVSGRMGQPELWNGERRRTSVQNWNLPLRWNRRAAENGVRERVFCASLADVFDNQVSEDWRADLWTLIGKTPSLDWLLLTKRPQNVKTMMPAYWDGRMPRNVWLGTTVENQIEADRRIPHLLRVPARVHFLSCEPLLGSVKLPSGWLNMDIPVENPAPYKIDWIICGGESGPGARPMHPDWARSLRDQCEQEGVPFLFKQWGDWAPLRSNDGEWPADANGFIRLLPDGSRSPDGWPMQRVGKKHAGRLLDGVLHDGYPR